MWIAHFRERMAQNKGQRGLVFKARSTCRKSRSLILPLRKNWVGHLNAIFASVKGYLNKPFLKSSNVRINRLINTSIFVFAIADVFTTPKKEILLLRRWKSCPYCYHTNTSSWRCCFTRKICFILQTLLLTAPSNFFDRKYNLFKERTIFS